ncbi:MAG: hypothetical protein JHC33_11735 [Ignisphaera sp.]|nr:hypothetical protein [Ignisphaera sp.]
METNSVIIITGVFAIFTAIVLSLYGSSKDLRVTIRMEDEGYPLKSDDVEELIVKPKRKYKKRTPKINIIKTTPVAKKQVGRPRKAK